MTENLCLSCGKSDSDSLKIRGTYLCGECESKLVASRADQSDYLHWLAICRKIWACPETKTQEARIKEIE